MSAFEVDLEGRILPEDVAARRVMSWLIARYEMELRGRAGGGSELLMDLIKALGDSVRIREAVGVSFAKAEPERPAKVEWSVGDAAPLVGCSPQYLRRMAGEGRVPARRIGHAWLIDVTRYLEAA